MKRFLPMFPAQASLSQVPSWRKVGHQIHEAPSAPPQFVSLMKSPDFRQLQRRSRAFSFDSRKPGDERPNALIFLQHRIAAPGHNLQRGRFTTYLYTYLPIKESTVKCSIGGGGCHQCFQRQIPVA